MHKFGTVTCTLSALAVAGAALAGSAAAAGGNAADEIRGLQDQGYHVQINYSRTPPYGLSSCTVTAVHGLPRGVTDPETRHSTTVYVDMNCPPDNN